MTHGKLITSAQAATIANVSRSIIWRNLRRGKIAGERLSAQWLVSESSLREWMRKADNHKRGNPAFVRGKPQGKRRN